MSAFLASFVSDWIKETLWTTRERKCASAIQHVELQKLGAGLVEATGKAVRSYHHGESIVKAGDEDRSMYILQAGEVQVVSPDGKTIYTKVDQAGALFGEWSLLTANKRTAHITCDGAVTVRELTIDSYLDMKEKFPQLARMLERLALRRWRNSGGKLESRKAYFIGREGYMTTIHSLPSSLSQFNNQIVKAVRVKEKSLRGEDQFEVRISDKIVLLADESKFDVTLDVSKHEDDKPVNQKKKGQVSNHSNAKWAVQDLCAQLRTIILQQGKKGLDVENIFARFDTDGNGELDQNELLAGCRQLGIDVSSNEIEAVWPIIDVSGDGNVDSEEFVTFVKKSGRAGHASVKSFKTHQESVDRMAHATKVRQRSRRIRARGKSKKVEQVAQAPMAKLASRRSSITKIKRLKAKKAPSQSTVSLPTTVSPPRKRGRSDRTSPKKSPSNSILQSSKSAPAVNCVRWSRAAARHWQAPEALASARGAGKRPRNRCNRKSNNRSPAEEAEEDEGGSILHLPAIKTNQQQKQKSPEGKFREPQVCFHIRKGVSDFRSMHLRRGSLLQR